MSNTSNNPVQNTAIGPFTKENFNQAKWKHNRERIYLLNTTNEEETIPEVQFYLQFLQELNASSDYNQYFGETSVKNYFFEDLMPSNAKNLIGCKFFNNTQLLELSNSCLEQMVIFWFRTLVEDHPKLAEMAKVILDPTRTYYKFNNQENSPASGVPGFLTEPTPEHVAWIESIKEGQLIDCIKIDQTYKKMAWSHAKVTYVMDSYLKIFFLNDHEKTSRYIDKKLNAHEIAPYKQNCNDLEWRLSLKEGDEVDAVDTSHVWYHATVLATRETSLEDGSTVKDLYIGYRIYHQEGDRVDSEGRRFSGWSSKYDEWLSATDPRITKRSTMARKLFMGASSSNEDPVVDDSNDRIYNPDGRRIYAIIRGGYCKSTFLINLVNKFGEMGGFERIYERITNPQSWAPIEVVSQLSCILGNLATILHRDFAVEYIPRLKEAVWRNLLNSPDSNIRNFTKDKIEHIVTGFEALLKRVYSLPEKQEMTESLNIQICCVCFDSQFLERKLQGLKTLLQIIKDVKYNSSSQKFMTNALLNGFLSRHDIFNKIFGNRGHVQLIQRSADFLKYMLHEDILGSEDFQTIWAGSTKGDMETKLAVYKVISDISLHLKGIHLDYLITKISEIHPQDIIAEEIDLVFEMCKFSIKPAWFIKKARDFYWTIISDDTGAYSSNIVEQTLNKFCDIMKSSDFKEDRINVLYDCVENIRKRASVLCSLKIMKKLIDHYPVSPASAEKFTKSTCIEHLCKEKNLLEALIEDLKTLKTNLKKKVENLKTITEEDLNSFVGEKASYLTHITERLQFIHYLLANNSSGEIKLTYELLSELWDVIVNNALVPSERDVIYKWIKEIANSKTGFPMGVDDLRKFFREMMSGNANQESQRMTKEGFKCFKNVFLTINGKLTKISNVNVNASSTSSYPGIYSGYPYSSIRQNDDKKKERSFGYKINVFPNELEGINSIWDFILATEDSKVADKAIDFLNKLYLHVGNDLESKIAEIRDEYLQTCNVHLKETLKNQSNLSETAFTNRCLRCLKLISSVMDESEKFGIGNLKSHSGLVKGELLSFNVMNDVSSGADVPKKVEIRLHSNTTIFELRVEIAKQFKATWDQVKLVRRADSKEIKDNENGRTLREIRLKNGETLNASKRPTPPIPQVSLIQGDDTMHPSAKKIFLEWFDTFSENGRMNPEQCANFIHSCTNDHCKAEDKRVKDVFTAHDDDRDGFLTLENFLKFYMSACKQRPSVVWSNLHSHHYRNDLKKVTEVEQEKVDITKLPRYLISANDEYFELIFSLLDFGGKIAIETWKLLNRLPTSPHMFAEIVMLKGVREESDPAKRDWNHILNSESKYKLLYTFHIIEYLMEDDEPETEEEEEGEKQTSRLLWARDPKLQEYKKTWQADFIIYGGFIHLFKIFNMYAIKNSQKLNVFDKNILSFVLKILKNYLSATFAATVPGLYRNLSFIRLFYLSLDFIQDYINSEHTRVSRENSFKVSQEGIPDTVIIEAAKKDGAKPKTDAEGAAKLPRKDSKAEEKKKEKLKIEETEEFAALVERLRGDLGSQILSTINLKDLIEVISNLGFNTLSDTKDLEPEDRMIVEFSLTILMAILLYDENNIKYFLNPSRDPNGHKDADKYVLEGIFFSKSVNVRKYFSHAIYVLCKHTQSFQNSFASKYFIGLFLNFLPSSNEDTKKDCIQYFELLCKLIEETYNQDKRSRQVADENPLDFKDLLQKVIERIKEHVSTERRNNLNVVDKVLMGLLNLCEKIVTVQPHLRDTLEPNLVEDLFRICLFNVQDGGSGQEVALKKDAGVTKEYVKCKSKESRQYAYKLLTALCKDHERNTLSLLESMKSLTRRILQVNTKSGWGYSPSSDTKSMYGYVGIKNLGCICYMNAMLQQFFMTPTFRYAILAADDKIEPNLVKKDKLTIDDNVLHQLQKMFGFLELSDRQDYNPQEFCFAFKDHAGNPVNVSVQQDTQEFLNMIFDKLEHGLKHTPFQHILEGVYGGKTSNQVICHGCGTMREREDIFYNLSVEVKNLKTIFESFDKFITGETIDDYYCDTCKKKNAITKRTCLSDLPNVLIVHLQRIVFDLDTLMNQKINTKLEFPTQLNLEPYTKEGLDWREKQKKQRLGGKKTGDDTESNSLKMSNKGKSENTDKKEDEEVDIEDDDEEEFEIAGENEKDASGKKPKKSKKKEVEEETLGPYMKHEKEHYEYKLAGVVVHVGTADFGHYYSYINTNREDLRGEGAKKTDKWLEYNDSMIKDFDVKDIENECFGGAGSDSSDDYFSWGKSSREYSKNAYILVYERVVKDPLKLVVRNEEDKTYLNKILKLDQVTDQKQEVRIEKVEVGEGDKKQVIENYYCDYFGLGKSILPRVDQSVWEDNHKFMFERHVYTEDFFKFVQEVCNTLKIPAEIMAELPPTHIYPKRDLLSPQVKQSLGSLVKILAELIFYLLARAYDNNTIQDLSQKFAKFLSLTPEAAWPLFQQIAGQDYKNVIELILNCPEKQVRGCTSSLLLYMVNVIISHHGLTLTPPKNKPSDEQSKQLDENSVEKIEESILSFLGMLRAHMPTEVAKNWLKFQQFFEFWKDFSFSGEVQMRYLYQNEFIAVLIDFYLEKKSPVPELSEKKHSMGNRYTEPEFGPLLQTVASMAQRSNMNKDARPPGEKPFPSFQLSANDWKCLHCPDFYEKCLKEKTFPAVLAVIIRQLCFENEAFSYTIAEIILKGMNRSNYEEVKTYLEAMSYFVSLSDSLQQKRLEWFFGYPQPIVSTGRVGPDSFGSFGNTSIEDLVVSYETPLALEGTTSFLNLILQGRKKFDNLCMTCTKQLLILLDGNPIIFQFVTSLPPPSYNYSKFTDWILPYIEYYLADAKKYSYSSAFHEELGVESSKLWKEVEKKLSESVKVANQAWQQAGIESHPEQPQAKAQEGEGENKEGTENKNQVLGWIIKPYIIGQTYKEEEIDRKHYTTQDISQEVSLANVESYCYITDSKATGKGNLAFPEFVMNETRFRTIDVNNESPLSLFIQPRGGSEPGKVAMSNFVENALKNKGSLQKTDVMDGQVIEPFLQDDSSPEEPKRGERAQNGVPAENVQGSSGDAEQLDKSPIEVEKGASNEQENTDQAKPSEAPVAKENLNVVERNGFLELERVVASPEDFAFTYELNPVVRRFIFYNKTPFNLIVQTRIVPKNGEFMNFRIPVSTFKTKVKPQATTCVLGLLKILPEVGWGEYDVECDIQKVEGVTGQKQDNSDSGKKKNVQFHIRPLNLHAGELKDSDEKNKMAAEDYYSSMV